jgi:hypothetical protein
MRATVLECELATRAREVAVSRKEAKDAVAKLQATQELINAARAERQAAEYRGIVRRARAAALELEIARLRCANHNPTQDANDRLRERDAARAELEVMRASRSWRFTRPLRSIAVVLSSLRMRRSGGGHFNYRGQLRQRLGDVLELLLRAYRFSPAFKSGANRVLRHSPTLATKLAAFAFNRTRAIANEPFKKLGHGVWRDSLLDDVNQPMAKVLEQLRVHWSFAQRGQ